MEAIGSTVNASNATLQSMPLSLKLDICGDQAIAVFLRQYTGIDLQAVEIELHNARRSIGNLLTQLNFVQTTLTSLTILGMD
jgi:hypothetical protein